MAFDNKRHIRSFGRLHIRSLTDMQTGFIKNLLPSFAISINKNEKCNPYDFFKIAVESIFLEIGFGDGDYLKYQLTMNPNIGFIGCEPYRNGVANLLKDVNSAMPKNLCIYNGDARDLLSALNVNTIDKVFILFPDPWPKNKQRSRRIISVEFLNILADVLILNGKVLVATDHDDYEKWIHKHFLDHERFEVLSCSKQEPENWCTTKYQRKALSKGCSATFFDILRI